MGKQTREEILRRLNGQIGATDTIGENNQESTGLTREEVLNKLNSNIQGNSVLTNLTRTSSAGHQIAPEPKDFRDLDASEKIGRAWNSGWGSVKNSFGAGLEWSGIKYDLESMEAYGRELKERGMKEIQSNYIPIKDFEWEDLGTEDFWTNKAPTILPSMLSLMGPAIVSGAVGSAVTAGSLGVLAPAALAEPTQFGKIALGVATGVGGLVAAATTSRALEGIMEAGGTWSEIMDELTAAGYSEEEAKKIAGTQAANVFKRNWALVGMDAAEFAIALAPIKGVGAGLRSARIGAKIAKRYGRNAKMPKAFVAAGKPVVNNVIKSNKFITRATKAVPKGAKITTAIAAQGAMEGAEELWQAWISSQAINAAKGLPEESWEEFWDKPETKEALALGAIGGIAMQGLGETGGALKRRLFSKEQKKIKDLKDKRKRFANYYDRMQNTTDPEELEGIQQEFGIMVMSDYVKEGKPEIIKERLKDAAKKKKIEPEVAEKHISYVDQLLSNYNALPKDMPEEQKGDVIQLIAKKTAITASLSRYAEQAKDKNIDANVVNEFNKVRNEELADIDEKLDRIFNPEKYETKNAETGKVEKDEQNSIFDENEKEEEFGEAPPSPPGWVYSQEEDEQFTSIEEEQEEGEEFTSIESTEEELNPNDPIQQEEDLRRSEQEAERGLEIENAPEPKSTKQTKKKRPADKIVSRLKRGAAPVEGTVSKNPRQKSGFTFTDNNGEEFTFYDHNNTVKDSDLKSGATLNLVEPRSGMKNVVEKDGKPMFEFNGKTYPHIVEVVGSNNRVLGNLQYSTRSEFNKSDQEKQAEAKARNEKNKGENIKKIESIIKDFPNWEIINNERNYRNKKTGKTYKRVSDVIGKEFKENEFSESSTAIGNGLDEISRDFFAGKLKKYNDYKNETGDHFIKHEAAFERFVKQLEGIKNTMVKRGEQPFSESIVLHNDKLGVAGTVDLLTIDKGGNVRIYDFKTFRTDPYKISKGSDIMYDDTKFGMSKREQHTRQLNLYRILLNNTHGIKASTIGVLPIHVGEYQPSDRSAKRANILKGFNLELRNSVEGMSMKETSETSENEYAEPKSGYDARQERRKESRKTLKKEREQLLKDIASGGLSSGGVIQMTPELIKLGANLIRSGYITFEAWADQMLQELKKIGAVNDSVNKNSLKNLWGIINNDKVDNKPIDRKKSAEEVVTDMLNSILDQEGSDLTVEITDEEVKQKFESSLRVEEDYNKVRDVILGHETKTGIPTSDSVSKLYELTHKKDYNETDPMKAIDGLKSMGKDAESLRDFLSTQSPDVVNSVLVTMKNIFVLPSVYFINSSRDGNTAFYKPMLANRSSELKAEYAMLSQKKLNKYSDQEIKKHLAVFERKRSEALNNYDTKPTPETRYAIVQEELRFLNIHTDINWEPYLENYKGEYETFKETFWATRNNAKTQNSPLYNYVLSNNYGKVFLENKSQLENKIASQLNVLAKQSGDPSKIGFAKLYRSVSGKAVSGMHETSELIQAANEIHTIQGAAVDKNPIVKHFRELKRPAKIFMVDGVRNYNNLFGKKFGEMYSKDVWMMLLSSFLNEEIVGKEHYLQPIEQLGDKSTNAMVESKKFSLSESRSVLEKISNKEESKYLPSPAENKAEIAEIETMVRQLMQEKSISTGNIKDISEHFYNNYKINKVYNDLYFLGANYNSHVDQVKRAKNLSSNGKIPNMDIKGGLGHTFNYMVVPDTTRDLSKFHKSFKKEIDETDGIIYMSERMSKAHGPSYGSLYNYNTSIKANYSYVDPESGNRVLFKAHSIVITEEMTTEFPQLKEYYNLLNSEENPTDLIVFKSSAKKMINAESDITTDLTKPKVFEGKTKFWRVQTDLRQNAKMHSKKMPVQLMRFVMRFDKDGVIQNSFNDVVKRNVEKFENDFVNIPEEEIYSLLLNKIPDVERNEATRRLLSKAVPVIHNNLSAVTSMTIGSNIEKKVLLPDVNGALYTPIPVPSNTLKPYRIENGVGIPGEVYVSETSGLKIGDSIFATRVPVSDMHSTAYLKVKGFLPASVGNIMVSPTEMTAIAGEDFDGDQRHLWTKFSGSDPNSKSINDAFDALEKVYKLDGLSEEEAEIRYQELIDPIDVSVTEKIVNDSGFAPTAMNKTRPSAFVKAYEDNRDSTKMISISARNNATYQWLNAVKATLTEKLTVPLYHKGKIVDIRNLTKIEEGQDINRTNASNINIAVDNLQEQLLEAMGLNDTSGTAFIGLEQFGLNQESVIAMMNEPVIKKYLAYVRKEKSETSNRSNPSFKKFAETLSPGTTKKEGSYNQIMKGNIPITKELFQSGNKSISKDIVYLATLNKVSNAFHFYYEAMLLTKIAEKGIKSYPEYYSAKALLNSLGGNKNDSLLRLVKLPQMIPGLEQIKLLDKIYQKYTPYTTPVAQSYIQAFEELYAKAQNIVRLNNVTNEYEINPSAPLQEEKVKSLTSIIDNMLMADFYDRTKTLPQSYNDASSSFKKLKDTIMGKDNGFLSSLELKDGALSLRKEIRNSDQSKMIDDTQMDFQDLYRKYPEDIKNITYYNMKKHGSGVMSRTGGFAQFYSDEFNKDLGDAMNKKMKEWRSSEKPIVSEAIINGIMLQDKSMIPEVNMADKPGGIDQMIITGKNGFPINPINFPKYVIRKDGPVAFVYTRQSTGKNAYYNDQNSVILDDFGDTQEMNPNNESLDYEIKNQDYNVVDPIYAIPEQENTEVRDYISSRLAEFFPDVQVFRDPQKFQEYIDKHIGEGRKFVDMEAMGAAFLNAKYINPEKAIQTTELHEHAHLYFDAIQDQAFKDKMINIFGSEEALIEAVAQAGVDISKLDLELSKMNRFKRLLRMFWEKVKSLFKIKGKKGKAEELAMRMLKNKDHFTSADFETKLIKYQGNVKEPAETHKLRNEAILEKAKEYYPNYKGDHVVPHFMARHMITGSDIDKYTGGNFKVNSFRDLHNKKSPHVKEDGMSFKPKRIEEFAPEYMDDPTYDITKEKVQNNKIKVQNAHLDYLEAHDEVEEMWNEFATKEDWNKLLKRKDIKHLLKNRVNQLLEIKNKYATGHLMDVLNMELGVIHTLEGMKNEADQKADNRPYTRAFYEMTVDGAMPNDLHNSILSSGIYSMLSPQGARSFIAQARQQDLQIQGTKAFNETADLINKLSGLREKAEKIAKKEGKENPFLIPEGDLTGSLFKRNEKKRLIFTDKVAGNSELSNTLNEWLQVYKQAATKYDHNQDFSKDFRVPMTEADFPELFSKMSAEASGLNGYLHSFMDTVVKKAAKDTEIGSGLYDDAYVHSENGPVTLLDYKKDQIANAKTLLQKGVAARRIRTKEKWIAKQAQKKSGVDAKGNFITQALKDPAIKLGVSYSENELSSNKAGIIAERHIKGIIEKHYLTELAPTLTFYKDFMGKSAKANYAKWMEMMDDKLLYGKVPESNFGAYGSYVQMLINMTAWRYLAINPLAAQFNLIAGITQTTTHHGPGAILKGIRRISKDLKWTSFDKGLLTSVGIRFMKSMHVVNTSQDTEISVTSKLMNQVTNIVFSPITFVEYINHAYTTIGIMEEHEWEAVKMRFSSDKMSVMTESEYKAKYNKDSKDVLPQQRINELLDESRRIHGAYHPFNRRPINSTPEGRMVMQFKNWLPDVVLAHIQNEYTDMNGVIRKGILTTASSAPAMNLYKSVFTGSPKEMKKRYNDLSDVDQKNLHKFMREAIMIGMIASSIAMLGADADDDQLKTLRRIMGDIGFIYDLDNAKFLLDGPVPIMGTMSDLMDASWQVVKVSTGTGETYARDSKFGEKGDYKAPVAVLNLLPAHRIIKETFVERK